MKVAEILYMPRSKWPKDIVKILHELHIQWGVSSKTCPLCKKGRK